VTTSSTEGQVIVVVDDDPPVLDSLKLLLEVAGHSVAVYASASAFLDDDAVRPACMIIDHHMPDMSGLDLIGRLRGDGINLPTLLVTGAPSPAILDQAALLGVEVLEKPVREEALLQFVSTHC
jgi:FixJ family two-component response regulator